MGGGRGAFFTGEYRNLFVEAGAGYPSAGFVILQGCRNPHKSVELKRLVLRHDGQGQGLVQDRLLGLVRPVGGYEVGNTHELLYRP